MKLEIRISKRRFGVLLLGLSCMSWGLAQDSGSATELPPAASVFERYVEATGGAGAYVSRTSEVARGTMEIRAAGLVGQLEVRTKPGLQYTRVDLPNVGVIESGVKDGVAWESNPLTGPRILTGAEAEYTIRSAQPNAPLHWHEQYPDAQTTGIEEAGGEPAYRVAMMSGELSMTNFFSIESGLLLKSLIELETQIGRVPIELTVDDYTDFDGILTPSRTTMNQVGTQIVITVSSGEANVEIPDESFMPPEAVQALLE